MRPASERASDSDSLSTDESRRTRMSRMIGKTTVVALAGALALGGCASSKTKPDETAKEQKADEVTPVGMVEEAPEAEKLATKNGVTAYKIGGMTVLHKPTPANQVVSAKLYIDGGVANLTEETAGIEQLALRLASNGGTLSTPKDEFTSALDSVGSSVSSFTGRDYSGYSLRTVVKHFDKSWGLFTEAVTEPAMPAGELKVQRKKQLASIEQLQENPNQYVSHIARKLMAGEEHPYRLEHMGTKENVEGFGRQELVDYHHELMNPNRMLLVVVGDVPADDVIKKTRESLARIEASEWERPELGDFGVEKVALDGATKKIPTNYILGLFPAPEPTAEDYYAMKVAMAHLSDRLFEEVRTKRNLSYAVASGISSRRTNSGYLYVSAKEPNKTLKVMFDEVDKLKNETLDEKELQRTRNVFLTEHYKDLETNSSQASNLAEAELVEGDWKRYAKFLEQIKAVTPEDVKRVTKKYMKDYQFGVVGAPGSIKAGVIGMEKE